MPTITTVKLHGETKKMLDQLREYRNESYDEVIRKVLFIVQKLKKEPELSKETIEAIELARKKVKEGKYSTEEEIWKKFGM